MIYIDVLVEYDVLKLNRPFTYACRQPVEPGCRVRVLFRNREVIGYVTAVHEQTHLQKVSEVLEVVDPKPLLNEELSELSEWMSHTYVCPRISCLKTMLPPALKPEKTHSKVIMEDWAELGDPVELTEKQRAYRDAFEYPLPAREFRRQSAGLARTLIKKGAVRLFKKEKESKPAMPVGTDTNFTLTEEQKATVQTIAEGSDSLYLLHGVTGSGKTEVFLQLAQKTLDAGRQVLFLVPEIGLTPLMIERVTARFGANIAIYHSRLTAQEKYRQYRAVQEGKTAIVVGTRSAVFMPFSKLGLILMDEEHDGSYKQDNLPRYQTRDIVRWRAAYHTCKAVFASATPALESYSRALNQTYHLVELKHRIYQNLPEIRLLDMRREPRQDALAKTLIDAIRQRLADHEQTILLLNRRGYLPIVRCAECGTVLTCPDCGIALTYHKREDVLKCHSCGRIFAFDHICPTCGSTHFFQASLGTEKLEEQVRQLFPTASILRMDADSTRKKHAHEKILSEFQAHGDILLGTQMVAKGLDFERVTLVGILQADASLARMDYRSAETAYEMLEQAAGRSGRGTRAGIVMIQTFDPDHYVMQAVVKHDYQQFFHKEMKYRRLGVYPPFVFLCSVLFSAGNAQKALQAASDAKAFCAEFDVIGPTEISMRQRRPRFRIVIKSSSKQKLVKMVQELADRHQRLFSTVSISINMDPYMLEE